MSVHSLKKLTTKADCGRMNLVSRKEFNLSLYKLSNKKEENFDWNFKY